MRLFARSLLGLGLVAILSLAWVPQAFAQGATTSSITGEVTDPDGVPLPGVTITIVHTPTGTRYTSFTRGDGRFSVFNVRVGGPYSVTAELQGFSALTREDLNVALSETLFVDFALQLQAVQEVVTVTATSDPIINPSRTGAASTVGQRTIEEFPTIQREIADYARLDPYFTATAENADSTQITVAGRNNRYNNIQIDGSVNNDLFGLADQGTPGGQSETNPVSLDAVQEISLQVSPYDVRQGGFSGGGVNIVTRSGANDFNGSAFYFRRGDGLVRSDLNGNEFGTFSDNNFGGRLGGPIVRDKVFFFGSFEGDRRETPTGFSVDGSGQQFGAVSDLQRFRDIMINSYGFDPGGFEEVGRKTDNNLIFARVDANLNDRHQLTVRHNYVDGNNQILRPNAFTYEFPSHLYNIDIATNSFVTQLNSVFGDDMYNEFRFTAQTIRGPRFGENPFPYVNVQLSDGRNVEAGTERFSTANNLDQTIFEFNDDLSFVVGSHNIVLGTHNELFSFDNLFIRENFGSYNFDSLDDFANGWAQSFNHSFSATSDPLESAKFNVFQLGFYAGDTWSVNDRLTLNYGVRLDLPLFLDDPTRNPASEAAFGLRTDEIPSGNALWSPRLGFNFDPRGDGVQQVRGGIGIFSGRPPYVWLSNQYSNTGIEFTRISSFLPRPVTATNNIPFVPDPFNQPTNLGSASTNEIDLTDPDFKYPSIWRATIGYDREVGWQDMTFTTEFIYSQTVNDMVWQNLNIVRDGGTTFDGRPTFSRFDSTFRDVIFLTNTEQGDTWNLLFRLQRPFRGNWQASGSYMYGDANSVNNGTSSQARSNWRFNEVGFDPNSPELGRADYSVGHRLNVMLAYDIPVSATAVRLSFFYDGQQGRPYSTTFGRDINNDFESNDLLFIPASNDDVIFTSGTGADFDAYLTLADLEQYRGQTVPRNASRAPWRNFSDFRASVEIPAGNAEVELSLDIRNLFNLLNEDWGRIEYTSFDEFSPVRLNGIDSATGKPIYRLQFPATLSSPADGFTVDDLRSRWQMRFGARVSF